MVRDRVQLPSCGSESVVHGIGINVEGRRCFGAAALANQGAEFVSSLVTIEGDPIVYIFRILPESRGAEAFLDSTRDRWSSRKWLHFRCRSLLLEETTPGIPEIGLGPDCVERELT